MSCASQSKGSEVETLVRRFNAEKAALEAEREAKVAEVERLRLAVEAERADARRQLAVRGVARAMRRRKKCAGDHVASISQRALTVRPRAQRVEWPGTGQANAEEIAVLQASLDESIEAHAQAEEVRLCSRHATLWPPLCSDSHVLRAAPTSRASRRRIPPRPKSRSSWWRRRRRTNANSRVCSVRSRAATTALPKLPPGTD